ncbi:ATP F0F1 synthase subunit B [Microvirga sp. W0021]|uniref:ATP synthase subunit b n=1 Tax=Hohaiivirga grylli TaxID=3133970 RepID=A0ABV0BHC6_9HYPH
MLASAETWVAIAFLIFVGILVYYKVPGIITSGLDKRTQGVADQLQEAKQLRDDAENLLKEFEAKRVAAEKEAEDIVALAKAEAKRISEETQQKMADFVARRTAAAEAKIAQAEADAAAEVKAAAIEAAVKASEVVLRGEVKGKTAEALITKGLDEVKSRFNA